MRLLHNLREDRGIRIAGCDFPNIGHLLESRGVLPNLKAGHVILTAEINRPFVISVGAQEHRGIGLAIIEASFYPPSRIRAPCWIGDDNLVP